MYRYTTPTLPITIDDVDFTEVDNFRIAIEFDKNQSLLFIVPANDARVDVENRTIVLTLTQEETASFTAGYAKLQVRIVYTSHAVQATPIVPVTIKDVIDEVIA